MRMTAYPSNYGIQGSTIGIELSVYEECGFKNGLLLVDLRIYVFEC